LIYCPRLLRWVDFSPVSFTTAGAFLLSGEFAMERSQFGIPRRPVHPLGYACENCFYVVKDPTPGSRAMKCCRYPPLGQMVTLGGQQATVSISPPVNPDEFCGEFSDREDHGIHPSNA
jgi:hypothetical protein